MQSEPSTLILGEFRRVLDDRYRLSVPVELLERWGLGAGGSGATAATEADAAGEGENVECVLAKERPGCLSLWRRTEWQTHLDAGVRVVESKLTAGRLGDHLAEVQTLGRLLSTRHRPVQLAGRSRLVIPEGFREFLGVAGGTEVLVVGAGVCIEIWQVEAWRGCLESEIPRFGQLLDQLSR